MANAGCEAGGGVEEEEETFVFADIETAVRSARQDSVNEAGASRKSVGS